MLGDVPQTWDEVWALEPGVYSWVQLIPFEWQPEDTPSGALRVELSVHTSAPDVPGGTRSAMLSYIDGAATRARYIGERTSSGDYWAKLATATPPQEFALPLAEDITALQPCTYWKNQFGEVTIGGCAANGISDNITIATLPAGFRPAKAVERPATLSGGGERYAGSVLIGTDGAIRIRTPATTNAVVFGATFIAEN